MYLGIDPGHTGGAVVWDGADVRLAWEWKRVDKGYRIRTEPRVGEVVDDLSVVAMRLTAEARRLGVSVVVLEALYIPRKSGGYASVLRAAEARGILSQVGMWTGAEVYDPRPSQWRKRVWGRAPGNRHEAKRRARMWASTYPGILLPKSDHVCEALCLAQYGEKVWTLEE
tara:strand:- start:252 stop:761 length:510 start_codon:yes stop_codon:yes gene_type:complete